MGRPATFDRADILDKSMALFWRKGFQGTSLKDLELALSMRPGSIYAAFGSKEQLFREALAHYAETSRAAYHEIIAAAESPLAGLAAHVRQLGCVGRNETPSNACMLVKTLLEANGDSSALREDAEAAMRVVEADFASAFRAAQQSGELAQNADPERLASRLQASIFGLRAYAQRSDATRRVAELAEDIASEIESIRAAPTEQL